MTHTDLAARITALAAECETNSDPEIVGAAGCLYAVAGAIQSGGILPLCDHLATFSRQQIARLREQIAAHPDNRRS